MCFISSGAYWEYRTGKVANFCGFAIVGSRSDRNASLGSRLWGAEAVLCFIREQNTPSSLLQNSAVTWSECPFRSCGAGAFSRSLVAVSRPAEGVQWMFVGWTGMPESALCPPLVEVPLSSRGREGHCRLTLSTAPAHKEPLAFSLLWLYIVVGVFPCVLFPHPKYRLFEGREYMFVQVCVWQLPCSSGITIYTKEVHFYLLSD